MLCERRPTAKAPRPPTLRALAAVILVLLASCGRESARQGSAERLDRLRLEDGHTIRLGDHQSSLAASLSPYDSSWRTNPNRSLFVGTDAGRVVALVASQGGASFPISRLRFGTPFEALQRQIPHLRPTVISGRPGVILDRSGFRLV